MTCVVTSRPSALKRPLSMAIWTGAVSATVMVPRVILVFSRPLAEEESSESPQATAVRLRAMASAPPMNVRRWEADMNNAPFAGGSWSKADLSTSRERSAPWTRHGRVASFTCTYVNTREQAVTFVSSPSQVQTCVIIRVGHDGCSVLQCSALAHSGAGRRRDPNLVQGHCAPRAIDPL